MDEKEAHKLFLTLCENAYKEGRAHQYEIDFPDVGMGLNLKFEDTETYKMLMKTKPKG